MGSTPPKTEKQFCKNYQKIANSLEKLVDPADDEGAECKRNLPRMMEHHRTVREELATARELRKLLKRAIEHLTEAQRQ